MIASRSRRGSIATKISKSPPWSLGRAVVVVAFVVMAGALGASAIPAPVRSAGSAPAVIPCNPDCGGQQTCPNPGEVSFDVSVQTSATTASISYVLTSSSAEPWAYTNVSWYTPSSTTAGTTYSQNGAFPTNVFIGDTSAQVDSITDIQPSTVYSYTIMGWIGCSGTNGNFVYHGEASGSWKTAELTDWQTTVVTGKLNAKVDGVTTCTMTYEANLTVEATDSYQSTSISSGAWVFSAGPIAETSISTTGSCSNFNAEVNTLSFSNIANGAGISVSWDPSFELCNALDQNCHEDTLNYLTNFYTNPNTGATIVVTQSNNALGGYDTGNDVDVLLEIIELAAEAAVAVP